MSSRNPNTPADRDRPYPPASTLNPSPPPGMSPVASQLVKDSLQTVRVATEAAAEASGGAAAKLNERLDQMAGQLQDIGLTLERVRMALESLESGVADHESRLRRIEQWQQRISPLLGLITFLLGAVLTGVLRTYLPGT